MELVMENLGNVITHLTEIKNSSKSLHEMVGQINGEITQAELSSKKRSTLLQQFSEPIGDIQHEADRLQQSTQRLVV